MTDKNDEWLSQWFDGEGSDFERRRSTDRVCEESDQRDKIARFQLISDSLQGQVPDQGGVDLASAVSAAIDAGDIHPEAAPASRSNKWLKPLSGGAIAATVAAVAIMATQPDSTINPGLTGPTPGLVVNANTTPPNFASTVSAQAVSASSSPSFNMRSVIPRGELSSIAGPDIDRSWSQLDPALKEALSRYIMDHHSGHFAQPVPAVIPSMRLVGFDEGQR